jgi:2-C-methyl-D-erythritol 2,4-cyclodiphosphate synthase
MDLERCFQNLRTGQGYDIHRFAPNRKLILGGIEIPADYGLLGHSDADVLVHALMDALLGACGKKDIGFYFPPNDNTYLNADSLKLLENLLTNVLPPHQLLNVDLTLIAEKPKIMGFIDPIKARIAETLKIEVTRVGLKATTNEGLGAIGRAEGIAALAAVLLVLK